MRTLVVLTLAVLSGCASHLKWLGPQSEPIAVKVVSTIDHPVVGSGLFASGQELDEVVFDGAVSALSAKGYRVAPEARQVLTIRLTTFDDSLLQSARAVRVGLELRYQTPAGSSEWNWGPHNIRLQLPAANRSVAPYVREAIARALDDGPQGVTLPTQKTLPTSK